MTILNHFTATVLAACLLLVAAMATRADAANDTWLLVDTRDETLMLMVDGNAEMVFDNIAIGRFGTSTDKRRADNTTPLGRFRVTEIRYDSDFHRFIALNYPDLGNTQRAYRAGDIGRREYQAIEQAHLDRRAPPQNTVLGGYIGIHGLGRADPELHESLNWTRGCVALTDAQLDRLLPRVRVGMTVEIR